MKKLLILPALIATTCAFADMEIPGEAKHGVSVGFLGNTGNANTYDPQIFLQTAKSNLGLRFGYLYDQAQGTCWRAHFDIHAGRVTDHGPRHHVTVDTNYRYRFALNQLPVIVSPIVGLKSDCYTLDRGTNWFGQSSTVYGGLELMTFLTPTIKIATEIKGERIYAHNLLHKQADTTIASELKSSYGIKVEIPVTFDLDLNKSHQLELRPTYHRDSLGSGRNTFAVHANLVHWF